MNYSGNFAFSKPNNLPKVASPYDLVMGLQNAGQTAEASLGTDVETWLKLLEEYNTNPSLYPGGEYVDRAGSRYYLAGHDRVKDMMDNFGFQQTHNLSISGASDKTSYYRCDPMVESTSRLQVCRCQQPMDRWGC